MFFLIVFNLVFVLACYVAGSIVLHFISVNKTVDGNQFFWLSKVLLTGLITVVTAFSAIQTKGITINLLFIFLLVVWFLFRSKKDNAVVQTKQSVNHVSNAAFVFIGLIVCTLICFAANHFFDKGIYSTGFADFYYYAYNGSKMVEHGIEGTDFTSVLVNPADCRVTYHYFDMWMLGLFRLLSFHKTPLLHVYFFNFTPIVLMLCWTSLLGVYQHFKQRLSWLDYIIAGLIVFYLFPVPTKFFGSDNVLTMPKIYLSLIVSSIAFVYVLKQKINQAVIIILAMPVMNILAMPVAAAATGLLIAVYFFQKKWKNFLQLSIVLVIFIALLLGFYKFFGNATSKLSIKGLSMSQYSMGFIKIFAKGTLQMLLGSAVLLIIMVAYRKTLVPIIKQHRTAFVSAVSLLFLSYLTSFIFWFNFDAFQIRNYPGTCIISILLVAIAAIINNMTAERLSFTKRYSFNAVFIALLCFTFYRSFNTTWTQHHGTVSRDFVHEIEKEIKDGDVYGYVYSSQTANESRWIYNPNLVLFNLNFVSLVSKDVAKVCLNTYINDDSIAKQTMFPPSLIKNGEFKKFIDSTKSVSSSMEDLQYQYAVNRKLNFLVLQKNTVLSPLFKNIIKKEIIDPVSGNSVVFLNR
jgi:hypothetical protein